MLAFSNTPNGTAPAERLEVDVPKREMDEVLINVEAFSLNRGELALLQMRPEGWKPGQDVAGVVAVAPQGSGFQPGDRVIALAEGGGWAEQVAVAAERVAKLPDEVSFIEAAALPMAGHTALRLLRLAGPLLGKSVLVTGARGGVGSLAVQLARHAGAEVVGVSKVEDDLEGSFDLVLESVGGPSLANALKHTVPHGLIVVFGNTSAEPTPFSMYDFYRHEGVALKTFFSYAPGMFETVGEDLATLVKLVSKGVLKPEIGFSENWGALADAVIALRERRFRGKAVLHVK